MTEVIDEQAGLVEAVAAQQGQDIQVAQPARVAGRATPADLVRIAVEQGADLDKLERLMAMQERWDAAQAKRAYDEAFAAFKAASVSIRKGATTTSGPLSGRKYAALPDVVRAITPALSQFGMSSSWKVTKDERDWIEITCYLRHKDGHEESVSMGGAPDTGPGRNAIQARASAKTYLERYTLLAITGMSADDEDDDGAGGQPDVDQDVVDDWVAAAEGAGSADELTKVWVDGVKEIRKTGSMSAYSRFKDAVTRRGEELGAAN